MKKLILFALTFFVSACAANKMLYINEKGQTVYQAKCHGMWKNMGDCYQLAAQQCPTGFNIMTANEELARISSDEQKSGNIDGYNVNYRRYIIYTCK